MALPVDANLKNVRKKCQWITYFGDFISGEFTSVFGS